MSFGVSAKSFLGREQRKHTSVGRARRPTLDRLYRYKLPSITPGDFRFELTLLRPRRPAMLLDRFCESFTWDESSSEMTGNLQLRRPDPQRPAMLPIERGHRVRCRVRWDGAWYELWTMRCKPPQVTVEEGLVSVDLLDDMDLVKRSKRDWHFRKTKHRPFGYFPQEIVRLVCRRAGIRVGPLAKGSHRLVLNLKGASPLDVFKAAYQHEREKTGRSFVIRVRNGAVEVVTLKRNPAVYVLARQIQNALITQQPAHEQPATVLTGRGRIGKGKEAKKVSFTSYDRRVVELLGYVHREQNYGRVESVGELRGKVKRDLAKMLKVDRTVQVTHAGIPFIRRGDGAMLDMPTEGFAGKQAFVYATTASHTVQGASYTSTWDFTTDDPYAKLKEEAEKAQRAAKRRERQRGGRVLVGDVEREQG